jgi:hypothetical protein
MILTVDRYITSDGKYPNFRNTWAKAPNMITLQADAKKLIARVSTLLSMAAINNVDVTSGWRPLAHNFAIGGAPNSKHLFAQAVDLSDPDKKIGEWCLTNIEALKDLGLYMESLAVSHAAANKMKRWVHLQSVQPKSGNIVFIP